MTHSRKITVVGIFLLTILIAQVSFAEQKAAGDPEYATAFAAEKLWRGVVNTFTGWGELIRQPIVQTVDKGWIGVPVGLVNGVFMTVVRTGSGLLEVVTFPVPFDDQIGYDSILNPDYVWQKSK